MPQKKKKRVTQQTLRRRRMTALAIIILLFIIIIWSIVSACSKNDDNSKENSETSENSSVTDLNDTAQTTPVQTGTIMEQNSYSTSETVTTSGTYDGDRVQLIKLHQYSYEFEVNETFMPYVTMFPDVSTLENADENYLEEKWESSDESIATVDWLGDITAVSPGECYVTVTSVNNPEVYAQFKVRVKDENGIVPVSSQPTSSAVNQNAQTVTTTIAPAAPTIENVDGITYVNGILIANKTYGLPEDYNPGLDSETESAFSFLSQAAANEGLDIYLSSGFRSFDDQNRIYNNYVDSYGQASADTFSARPGHSEHQTGFAIDVNTIDDSFAGTPEAIWLENHAHEYGFIIRYPKGKESITGYKYEPWHIRYIGVEKAKEVYNSGLTLEEFLGIDSVYQN